VPLIRTQRYERGRRIIEETPLFADYIFCNIDLKKQRWRSVNSTLGVIYLLPPGAELPTAVPTSFVDALQAREHTVQQAALAH
jgi:transcription antitermination factor NusG